MIPPRSYKGSGDLPLPEGYFDFDLWPRRHESGWHEGAARHEDDHIDFHVDLGCGRLPKGRIGVDRYPADGAVNVVADLDRLETYWVGGEECPLEPYLRHPVLTNGLPFEDSSIESMVTHHAMEHIGEGFLPLMDECYRVLKPDAPFRIIVPLFPSMAAVEDPDHKRYFAVQTFDALCGTPGALDDPQSCWLASFSVPYTKARFEMTDRDYTPEAPDPWALDCKREIRVTLVAKK